MHVDCLRPSYEQTGLYIDCHVLKETQNRCILRCVRLSSTVVRRLALCVHDHVHYS